MDWSSFQAEYSKTGVASEAKEIEGVWRQMDLRQVYHSSRAGRDRRRKMEGDDLILSLPLGLYTRGDRHRLGCELKLTERANYLGQSRPDYECLEHW